MCNVSLGAHRLQWLLSFFGMAVVTPRKTRATQAMCACELSLVAVDWHTAADRAPRCYPGTTIARKLQRYFASLHLLAQGSLKMSLPCPYSTHYVIGTLYSYHPFSGVPCHDSPGAYAAGQVRSLIRHAAFHPKLRLYHCHQRYLARTPFRQDLSNARVQPSSGKCLRNGVLMLRRTGDNPKVTPFQGLNSSILSQVNHISWLRHVFCRWHSMNLPC